MKPTYRPELDALRFLAFALVFLCHAGASISGDLPAWLATITDAGRYGVDLFFLLSAYLITTLFLREEDRTGTIDIMAFYRRRALRIWPLYFVFAIVTLALSRFTPVQFPDGAIAPFLLFYGNWYLTDHPFFSPAGILWSVSVEEQFYLLCPLAMALLSRRGLVWLAVGMLVVATASRCWFAGDLWYNTLARLDPIAAGMLFALVGREFVLGGVGRVALALAGLGILCVASACGPLLAYPMATVGALAVFVAFLGASVSWRPVIYLGRISYGLYVFHLLGLDVAKVALLHFTGACPFWARGIIGLAVAVPLAMASYRWLEAPFLRLKAGRRVLDLQPSV